MDQRADAHRLPPVASSNVACRRKRIDSVRAGHAMQLGHEGAAKLHSLTCVALIDQHNQRLVKPLIDADER